MSHQILTVSQLNNYIKSVMEGDPNLTSVFIEGEISNFKNHYSSGHLYFSLKDEDSAIRCVMFRSAAQRLKFKPEDTMKVICFGRVSVYPRDGAYQVYVEDIQPTGIGALALAYEQLKKKLAAEGLFDADTKRPLPSDPRRIAVITSETGAALQDIISVISRRNPKVNIVLCPVIVQGEAAAESMCEALEKVYLCSGIDLIIIGRGGGSYEDLYCFNDEELVRKLYESPIPVISAVGHETDFTLCDFVADLRVPTPSAAAEIAVADARQILERIRYSKYRISELTQQRLNLELERFDRCISSAIFEDPQSLINSKLQQYKALLSGLKAAAASNVAVAEGKFSKLIGALDAMNPAAVISRGYSLVKSNGTLVNDASKLKIGEKVEVTFGKGSAACEVLEIKGD